jgi:hypothetical protein
MNKTARLLLLCVTLSLLSSAAVGQAQATGDKSMLQIHLLNAKVRGRKLTLRWQIANSGPAVVYVYSTFLHGPAAGYQLSDKSVLIVNTSLMTKSPVGVNFYPKAQFLKIEPGKSIRGTFRDGEGPDYLLKTGSSRAVILNVAYGSEIAQLEQGLRAVRSSDQHPANPIVEWQTIAHSNALDLR